MRIGEHHDRHHHWALTLVIALVPAMVIFGRLIYLAVTWSVLWTLLALVVLGVLATGWALLTLK